MILYTPWKHQHSRVLHCKLSDSENTRYMNTIREWVIQQNPSQESSSHWWQIHQNKQICIPEHISYAFNNIAYCTPITTMFHKMFGRNSKIDILHEMNEIYVSPPTNVYKTSDEIFYTRHIDGPYFWIPFASCYRVIIGLDHNDEIITVFNMIPQEFTIQKGDVVAFDFHRECHYIKKNLGYKNDDYRVVMKIHYCIYPSWAYPFGKLLAKLSIHYNKNFRNLFLYTISPKTYLQKIVAYWMIMVTKIVHDIEAYVGYNNISYILLMWMISRLIYKDLFLYATSFVHYKRLIDSYYHQCDNKFSRRDYLIYKLLSIMQILYWYIHYTYNNPDYIGCTMIFVGYFIYFLDINVFYKYCEFYILLGLLNSVEFNKQMHYYINMHIFGNFIQSMIVGGHID
jgi:hypothetical protein